MDKEVTQEEVRWCTEDYDMMRELGINKETYGRLVEKGFRRLWIDDEDESCGAVFVFMPHYQRLRDYYDGIQRMLGQDANARIKELTGLVEDLRTAVTARVKPDGSAKEPVKSQPLVSPPAGPDGSTKGKQAYEGKLAGESWDEIGGRLGLGSPLNSAKKYAKANGLTWPIEVGC